MRSGYVGMFNSTGTARYAGLDGYVWPQTTVALPGVPSAMVYLLFDAIIVDPSYSPYGRWNGHSLRCLSTALEG